MCALSAPTNLHRENMHRKIQLLFSKFKKQFLNFQLESVEYSDICIWKF